MASDGPTLLILAAGRSTRYGRPKQLDPLGPTGASLMAYTVVDALRAGFARLVIVTASALRTDLDQHLRDTVGRDLPITWVYQRIDDLPSRLVHLATSRRKPWGTGQAVVAADGALDGPFAVANADDWYGPAALEALAGALRAMPGDLNGDERCPGVAIGYPMETTLSRYGGVSRGWIQLEDGDRIRHVLELTQVRASAGTGMVGFDPEGASVPIPRGAPASMNLWGFHPCVLPLLDQAFEDFLLEYGGDSSREFPLSTAVDRLLESGDLELRMIPAGRRWFGVTHPDDAERVSVELEALHKKGLYANPLGKTLG